MEENNSTSKEEIDPSTQSDSVSPQPEQPKLEEILEELAKVKNDYLYLQAEFDNYRKNAIKERSQYLKYAGERLVIEMLNVLDNFDRALESFKSNAEDPFYKGVDLIRTQFKTALEQYGVSEIPSDGKAFDPNIHEALSSEESETVEPGYITRVFRKAYKFHDKIVRPAQVVVATKKPTPSPD